MSVRKALSIVMVILLVFALLPANGEKSLWDCPECGRTGNTGNYCGNCAHPSPWIGAQTENDSPDDTTSTWIAELEEKAATEASQSMTHEQFIQAELDSPVVVETYVQATQSWWNGKITVYAQSQDGAYFIYNMACTEKEAVKLVPGTKIRVSGTKFEWAGEVEIGEATFEFMEGEAFIALPEDVTALLGKDELAEHMNEKITFKGLKVAPSKVDGKDEAFPFLYAWDGSGSRDNGVGDDLFFNVEVNGTTYNFYVESYLCNNNTDVYKAVGSLNIGDTIDCEGFLYWYNGPNPHITNVIVTESAVAE